MKLEEPIEVSVEEMNAMKAVMDKMLLHKSSMFRITDVVFENKMIKTKKGFLFKKTIIKPQNFITEIEIWGWHPEKKFWGTLPEDTIRYFIYVQNLSHLRDQYLSCIKQAFDSIGYEIVKKT
jgi:hypothetical protein